MNDDGDHHLRSLVQIQGYTSAESLLRYEVQLSLSGIFRCVKRCLESSAPYRDTSRFFTMQLIPGYWSSCAALGPMKQL